MACLCASLCAGSALNVDTAYICAIPVQPPSGPNPIAISCLVDCASKIEPFSSSHCRLGIGFGQKTQKHASACCVGQLMSHEVGVYIGIIGECM